MAQNCPVNRLFTGLTVKANNNETNKHALNTQPQTHSSVEVLLYKGVRMYGSYELK